MLAALLALSLQVTPAPAATPIASPPAAASPAPSGTPGGPAGELSVSPGTIEMNPAQQRVITVTGATAPLQATLDQKLVGVAVDPSGANVTLTANQATGSDLLHLVDANGARADVPIRVAFNAGTILPQATLKVTGTPVDPGWLVQLAGRWVARLTQALPGASTTVTNPAPPADQLAPGAQTQLAVPVQISDGDGRYFAQSGTTTLTVQNVALPPFAPALLFYDDDPEHLTQDGVLFRGSVDAAQPAGLYYYHDDGSDPRRLIVALTGNSQDPTSVELIDSSAGPNIDVMQVGHSVSRNFLTIEPHGEGAIVDLAGDDPVVLHDVSLAARQGAAGQIDLRVLSGGPVTVTVLAVSPGVDPRSLLNAAVLPDDGHHRTGVFRIAGFGHDRLDYTAGGEDAKLVIGDRDPTPPSVDPAAPGHDYGDYGVLHSLDVNLRNPGSAPVTAYLYFRPIAGIDRASFLVDGNLVELGCVREPVPYQISSFELAPGQQSRATVQTMTDGGSFYPAEIGVTATPPQPSAPPITAPDGCFPRPAASPEPSPAPPHR